MTTTPERELWSAVLERGLRDAILPERRIPEGKSSSYSGKLYDEVMARRTAAAWISTQDFNAVCYLAGMNPEFVRDRFRSGKIDFGGSNLRVTQGPGAGQREECRRRREPSLPPGFGANGKGAAA